MASTTVSTTINGSYTVGNNNMLTITGSGEISALSNGFAVFDSGTIGMLTNDGSLYADAPGGSAVGAGAIGTLTNAGMISGSNDGIYDHGSLTSLDNQAGASITAASGAAISAGAIGTLTNEGAIDGQSYGIEDTGNLTSLDNAGAASIAGQTAIDVSGSIGTLDNDGAISTGQGGTGVQAGSIDTLENTGTIGGGKVGVLDSGNLASLDNATLAAITGAATGLAVVGNIGTLTNEGTIHGNACGIVAEGTADIENSGTISGGAFAIYMFGADSTLTLESGSVMIGSVNDAAGDGTLVLAGSSAMTVTGIGSQYTGFDTISLDTQDATIEGNADGLADSQTITGYQYGDSIKLDNFAAVSETYVAGTGLILTDAASSTVTLDIAGGYSAGDFAIASDGTNTIITDPTITISSSVTSQVDFGTAQNLVVTNSGTIITGTTAVLAGGAIGTITNSGDISGGAYGIDARGYVSSLDNASGGVIAGRTAIDLSASVGTLTNDGMITGGFQATDYAVNAAGDIGTLSNSGTIEAYVAVDVSGTITTLDNSGFIGGAATAIFAGSLTSLTNATSGTIVSSGTAINVGGTIGTLTNDGSIVGSFYDGLNVSGDIVSLSNFGTISGHETGIADNGGIDTLTNDGSIAGGNDALDVNAIGTLTNNGNISGGQYGILDGANLTSLDNTAGASISGGTYGLCVEGSIGTLTNDGSISATGQTAKGVYANSGITTLSNSGVIEGWIAVYAPGSIETLTNDGTISSAASGYAVAAGTIGLLTNSGTISGGLAAIADTGTLTSLDNEQGGSITANHTAIYAGTGIGMVTNAGIISGGIAGIFDSCSLDTLDNKTGAAITAYSGAAISAVSIGILTNEGIIDGNTAIQLSGSMGTLTNTGTISGGNHALYAATLTSLDNAAGGVISGHSAIDISGSIGSLTNTGIIASSGNGDAVHAGTIGTLTNSGTISAATNDAAVQAGSITALTNSGVIDGGQYGIAVTGNLGSLTNEVGGTITTAGFGAAVQVQGDIGTLTNDGLINNAFNDIFVSGAASIVNSGTISAFGGAIVDIGNLTSLDNGTGGVITGGTGVSVRQSIGTLTNDGTISADFSSAVRAGTIGVLTNGGTISAGTGPYQRTIQASIGTLTNAGTIEGNVAIDAYGAITSFSNSGDISGSYAGGFSYSGNGDAVEAGSIGTLTNESGGIIQGHIALDISGSIGTLSNTGTIAATGTGSAIHAGSIGTLTNDGSINGGAIGIDDTGTLTSLDNAAGATISGASTAIHVEGSIGTLTNEGAIGGSSYGLYANGAASIENAGSISGGAAAIAFNGAGSTLTIDPTSVIVGQVVDTAGDGTLVLGGSSANTVTGIGTQYTGFATISFDNANATAEGSISGLASSQTITGMNVGDSITLDGFAAVSETYVAGTGLILTDADSNTETLDIVGGYSTQDFALTNDGTNTTITETEPLCFLPGTLILTPTGEVPVEVLRIGDLVVTLDGHARPIRWIGHGRLLAPAGRRGPATPVLIRRGALADNVPHRDLYVTKGHALYLNGVLIPAEFLVNHRSILWDDRGQEVTFYHIELDGHEILRANGAPAESYRDEANRWMFANSNPAWDQPGVAPFAPVLTGGPRVDAAWRHLLRRSGINLSPLTTTEPDLHLLIDGARIEPIRLTRETYAFAIPAHASRIAIASRAAAPDLLGTFRDPRRLGVAVARIVLWQDGAPHIIDADDDALTEGFHGYEPEEGCRWTNGHGVLPAGLERDAPCILQLYIRHTARYAAPAAALHRGAA